MGKVIYLDKKSFVKYDSRHYLLYLNEEVLEDYVPESPDKEETGLSPVTAYAYSGDQADGSTMIEAQQATYEAFVSGLVRLRYSSDQVEAITLNKLSGDLARQSEFDEEFAALNRYRLECKAWAKQVLNLEH